MVKLKGEGGIRKKEEGGGREGKRRERRETENKMNKRDGRQFAGKNLSPAHTVEKKCLIIRTRTRTHAPQRGQTETRRLELYPNRERNSSRAGQHREAGECGDGRRRERAHGLRAGPGAGSRAGGRGSV